ncbi:E3 ubiquitin-protein ligase Topors [Telopea speciosissima]|uniref:E3 ubiquitin-protein ligase Topors n=1 Tax=Telopea speciosissima TaxID=54955 RepID=UPI001CC65D61|nr:E3 ubiquitin-protein ligase Topors [Telopea speciosissima]XP_043707948.1 E3 ubiquitin-protein ligase Topors [Telopea speciosissima]
MMGYRSPRDSSSSFRVKSTANREKLILKRLVSAIQKKSCPICLSSIRYREAAVLKVCMHAYCIKCIRKWSEFKRNCPLCNKEFDSWFFNVRFSTGSFEVERLSNCSGEKKIDERAGFGLDRRERFRSVIQRSRNELLSANQRSRPVPWRRSFGQFRSVPSDIVAERVVQWRASIYSRRLQAVPFPTKNSLVQNILGNDSVKEGLTHRVEPWIQRELQAILGDPYPSIIVQLASSLLISSLEEKLEALSKGLVFCDTFVEALRPFLCDQTNMFWHELRCFANSEFTMKTYDSVVEYRRLN